LRDTRRSLDNDERGGDNEFFDDRPVLDNPQFHDSPQRGLVTPQLDCSLHLVNNYPDFHTFAPGIPNPLEYCGVTPNHLTTEFSGNFLPFSSAQRCFWLKEFF
jgi:hypothetical protein